MFVFCTLHAADIKSRWNRIPQPDQVKIERLFEHLVQKEGLGFVLFEETKPACMISLPLTHKRYVMPYKHDEPLRFQREIASSWRAWEKYRHLFEPNDLIVCEEYDSINGGMYLQLFVINKKTAACMLEDYKSDFEEVLGESFVPTDFLAKLKTKKKLRPLLHFDEKLLGLFLGFGHDSSSAFRDLVNGGEVELEKAGYRPPGCIITPVAFRGVPNSSEVESLVDAYSKEVLEIEKIFEGDRFVLQTLERYSSR
ncbi:MAG: hypothetical protein K0U13_01100 [Chlamydiae bacterium]|nr:hypothetical protein [Chlamydiota bacterium]